MKIDNEIETDGLVWAELTEDDVLIGRLDPDHPSRLGTDPDEAGGALHADLNVAPDVTGKILVRVPEEVAPDPEELESLVDLCDVWEPRFDDGGLLVGARGVLHYSTLLMPWGEVYLEVIAEEAPFG